MPAPNARPCLQLRKELIALLTFWYYCGDMKLKPCVVDTFWNP